MLILGQKGANLDQKGPKMGGTRFFPVLSLGYFINRPKIQFKYAKLTSSYDLFPRNWRKFWAKKGIFGPKLAHNGPNKIFRAKSKNVTSTLGSPNFVPNFRKFL